MTHVVVVVPVYNGRDTLPRCLESLLGQALKPRAIYAVDNGSTDGTFEWLQSFAVRHRQVRPLREGRRGPAAARNAGIRAARAEGRPEFVAFTDADCIAEAGWLEDLYRGFEDSRVGAVVGSIRPQVHRSLVGSYLRIAAFDPGSRDRLASSVALREGIAGGNGCVRMAALEEVGSFDESLLVAQDWDLGLRLLRAGWWIRYTPRAVVHHLHPERTVGDLLRLAAKYGRGRPSILARHFPRHLFLSAFGRQRTVSGGLTGSVHVTSPEKVALALCAISLRFPWAWPSLLVYGTYLAARIRSTARERGEMWVRPWQLPALVLLELAGAAVGNLQALRVGLRMGVLCV